MWRRVVRDGQALCGDARQRRAGPLFSGEEGRAMSEAPSELVQWVRAYLERDEDERDMEENGFYSGMRVMLRS